MCGTCAVRYDADVGGDDELKSPEWNGRHEEVLKAGGLHVVGTERHRSRRVDNQLRGHSGRQGDPGSSRFFLSLEDDLMRIFASERMAGIMQKLGMEDGEAIEHRMVTRAIENAQKKVECRNFDIPKQLLEYDDVANDQRKEIYALRNELMSTDDVSDMVDSIRHDALVELVDGFVPPVMPTIGLSPVLANATRCPLPEIVGFLLYIGSEIGPRGVLVTCLIPTPLPSGQNDPEP